MSPPLTGVPTPGAIPGSTTSRSKERWTRLRCERSSSTRATTLAIPWASTSFMVYACTPASARSRRSSGSTLRKPTSTTSSGCTLAPPPPTPTRSGCPKPHSTASGMPSTLPDSEVSGVLKSAWASTHRTPVRPMVATPATVPIETEWSPPKKTGKALPVAMSRAVAAVLLQTSRMVFR